MNFSFFLPFAKSRKTNRVFISIDHIKKHPIFKRARFDLYLPTLQPDHLIVVLGQVHTVLKGKTIKNRDRKKIVACQARLASFYAYFEQFENVTTFGAEGMYHEAQTLPLQDIKNLYENILKNLQLKKPFALEQLASVSQKILHELGKAWHNELKAKNMRSIALLAEATSGQVLFDYLNEGRTQLFPIEGEAAYRKVLEGVISLGHEIERLEETALFAAIRRQAGKAKTEDETVFIKEYNRLIQDFNRLMKSDIRERATLTLLKEKSEKEPITLFTMGIGHRSNYLNLVDEYLKDTKTAFLFITPPELRMNLFVLIGLPLLTLILLLFLLFL